ncbi:MAG TPA: MFS transporter, partial [Tepidisphaeraceae bacterium]|nr:MFS transporter [Tepidisphaeraceae bacterium]
MEKPAGIPTVETPSLVAPEPWYRQVTRYQWLVLAIASAGWAFDAFEGQIYALTWPEMLRELVGGDPHRIDFWAEVFKGVFLAGGAVGGIAFASLADRIGRKPVMAITILLYSLFSGLTYFASSLWHVAILRFLVALGVGGEWAVAAALVAEVFPQQARAR